MTAGRSGTIDELLAELERIAEERRLPVARSLLAGADSEELAEARALMENDLPDDLERLYRWHSGVNAYHDDASLFPALLGGPGLPYVGTTQLGQSLALVKRLTAAPSYGVDDLQPGDIPLFASQYEMIVFRMSTQQVHVFNMEEPEALVFPSLSDLLRLVVNLWRSGVFWVDPDEDISYLESNHARLVTEIEPYRTPS